MPVDGYDSAKCRQRNRLAARRDQVDALPFTFLRAAPADAQRVGLRYAHGTLPATPDAALERINALLPPDKPRLTLDQVYIHYLEAANNRYIGERDARPMFLGDTTLRNIAQDASAGIAFMNSHRTGGLSHPADLPMGKTFAGRYEEYQDGTQRAVVGIYLLRGVYPNGANGPSTDDLHAAISGGTQDDVSVGLSGGEKICDVCGEGVNATKEEEDADGTKRRVPACKHVPGTTHKMSKDQVAAQQARGVKTGVATYTLHQAQCGEISAVYDGAVPGAGFTKLLHLARELTPTERAQARQAYATLLKRGDIPMDDVIEAVAGGFERALVKMGWRPTPEPALLEAAVTPLTPLADPRMADLETQLAAAEARATAEAAQAAAFRAEQAVTWADRLVETGRIAPAARPFALALYRQALTDDAVAPEGIAFTTATGEAGTGSRAEVVRRLFATDAPVPPTGEAIPAGSTALPSTAPSGATEEERLARRAKVLSLTPLGRQALKNGKD